MKAITDKRNSSTQFISSNLWKTSPPHNITSVSSNSTSKYNSITTNRNSSQRCSPGKMCRFHMKILSPIQIEAFTSCRIPRKASLAMTCSTLSSIQNTDFS